MPGESRTVTMEFDSQYLNGGTPVLSVEGWNITAAEIDSTTITPGDVDMSGTVDTVDALMTLQAAADKVDLTDTQQQAADVNGDADVTAQDALLILQKATGQRRTFPCEENSRS